LSAEKARVLLKQAEADLEIGCFEKAASSAYFAARMACEVWARRRGVRDLPRRDDKLANLVRNLGRASEAESLLALYELRKKADYSPFFIEEGEAKLALEVAREVMKLLQVM